MHFYRLIPTFSEGEGGVQFVMHPEMPEKSGKDALDAIVGASTDLRTSVLRVTKHIHVYNIEREGDVQFLCTP